MIKTDIKIDGITYTVRSTTGDGIQDAIRAIKRAVKQNKKQDEENGDEA